MTEIFTHTRLPTTCYGHESHQIDPFVVSSPASNSDWKNGSTHTALLPLLGTREGGVYVCSGDTKARRFHLFFHAHKRGVHVCSGDTSEAFRSLSGTRGRRLCVSRGMDTSEAFLFVPSTQEAGLFFFYFSSRPHKALGPPAALLVLSKNLEDAWYVVLLEVRTYLVHVVEARYMMDPPE